MSFDEDLGARLRAAVPAEPDTSQWARGARQARRRRHRLAGAAAVVAAFAVAGTAWFTTRPGPVIVQPASQPPLTQVNGELAECQSTPRGGTSLPTGASSITLCADGTEFQRMWAPLERLTTDVDRYVAKVNDAERLAATTPCTMELGPAYKAVFTYPDGSHRVVTGQLYGCRVLGGDVADRRGADTLFAALLDGWTAQRRDHPVVATREGTWCPTDEDSPVTAGRTPMLAPRLDDIVAARVCQAHPGRPGLSEHPIGPGQVDALLADIRAHSRQATPAPDFAGTLIVLASASGDLATCARLADGTYLAQFGGEDEPRVWSPSPEAERIVRDAVA